MSLDLDLQRNDKNLDIALSDKQDVDRLDGRVVSRPPHEGQT